MKLTSDVSITTIQYEPNFQPNIEKSRLNFFSLGIPGLTHWIKVISSKVVIFTVWKKYVTTVFVCVFVGYRPIRNFFTHWRYHYYRCRTTNFTYCRAFGSGAVTTSELGLARSGIEPWSSACEAHALKLSHRGGGVGIVTCMIMETICRIYFVICNFQVSKTIFCLYFLL